MRVQRFPTQKWPHVVPCGNCSPVSRNFCPYERTHSRTFSRCFYAPVLLFSLFIALFMHLSPSGWEASDNCSHIASTYIQYHYILTYIFQNLLSYAEIVLKEKHWTNVSSRFTEFSLQFFSIWVITLFIIMFVLNSSHSAFSFLYWPWHAPIFHTETYQR